MNEIRQKAHWWFFVRQIMAAAALSIIALAAWYWAGAAVAKAVLIVGLPPLAVFTAARCVMWGYQTLTVYGDGSVALRAKEGWKLTTADQDISIDRIVSVLVDDGSILEKAFGSGDLRIETAGNSILVFNDVHRVGEIRDFIAATLRGEQRPLPKPQNQRRTATAGDADGAHGLFPIRPDMFGGKDPMEIMPAQPVWPYSRQVTAAGVAVVVCLLLVLALI